MREKVDPLTGEPWPVESVLYTVKAWFHGYLSELADLVEKDHRRTIRRALEDEDAMGRAVERASKCDACRQDAAKELFGMITTIIDQVDYAIDKVPFEDAGI
ncbi:hypothetical protein NM688_g2978 [Phlebia brevispora]|uniref:Uncharacterized protein n=1 Tax=Phlebia brevispora TaxID=194682 RepID=A0ACC1T725_9APHY|nr:hypothetical protein NM688_g2978 [Phlebia brevispora]